MVPSNNFIIYNPNAMLIYLVRHGNAVPEQTDPACPLSEIGRAEVEATAKELLAEGAKIDEVWHSGKLRAKQTAEILAKTMDYKG
jgi:phosphohistidine phosphatase